MNIKKEISGNISQAYENIIRNSNNKDYKRVLHNRKSPLYKNLKYFNSFNRSPEPSRLIQDDNYYNQNYQKPSFFNKYDTEFIKLEENFNINDYLKKNQNRKRVFNRSPKIASYNQIPRNNNNYQNYNKINILNNAFQQIDSDDYKNNILHNQFSENNIHENWKRKILQINEQKSHNNYYNNNYNINDSYRKIENINQNINYNQNNFDYSNGILSQSVNINFTQPKEFYNYNKYDNNNSFIPNKINNLNNDYIKKNSKNSNISNAELSENSIKNQTYQNYYYTNYNNFPNYNLNNDTSSSNFYDESYELNKTENCTKNLKNKFSDISKFLSVSSQENSSFELNKGDDPYNTFAFKHPMKNDEEHYHQNLTIKIKKKDEKNKKKENLNISAKSAKPPKYVENTPEGCNISVNTDINNIKQKKINKFRFNPDNKNIKRNNLDIYSNLDCNNNYEEHSKLSNTTMFIPPRKINNYLSFNNNDYSYNDNNNKNNLIKYNKNRTDNKNTLYPQKDLIIQGREIKGRSPQNNHNNNKIYNNIPSNNKKQNEIYLNNNNFEKFQNNIQDEINYKKSKLNLDKKIKEITVDLSPRKKLFNLSNFNKKVKNNKINNITPNYNYNLNDINSSSYNDKFNINNVKPKSKIESCIITFEKPKNNNNYKLSSSFDGTKFNKIKYIKKKIPNNNNNNQNTNNNYNFYDTPGIKSEIKKNNNILNNKNRSANKIYQKPEIQKHGSLGNNSPKVSEKNNEVIDYSAPSPGYGRRDKILNSDMNNNSPLLASGNFKNIDNSKKEQISPQKYDEFSFKEKINNNINDINYSNSKPIKVKIINNIFNENNPNPNNNINKGKIKSIYMKKTKSSNTFNNNNNIFTSQRIPTFSNIDEIIYDEENKNIKTTINIKNNKNKKINEVTPFGDVSKNEKVTKLTIKSFSAKKKEIKERPKISYSFFMKYFDLYIKLPKNEFIYISKKIIKPEKKPTIPISYISKKKYNYIFKLPISSYQYYTKKFVSIPLILPKKDVGYITKIFIKNKEYIENKLNNIGKDQLVNNNDSLSINTNKKINSNIQNKPIKKRIILIRKSKKTNKILNNNDNKKENNNKNNEINAEKSNINLINIISDNNNKLELSMKENKSNNDNDNNDNSNNNLEAINDYLTKDNNLNNYNNPFDNVYFKKKKTTIKREKLLPNNNKFDNENSFTSDNDNISFNLNINKEIRDSKNNSKNTSRLFLFHKSIDNSTIKSKSSNTSLNESLNQSSSFINLIKTPALNFSVINNLNQSINNGDKSFSHILNNTINIELDKYNINKKNNLKIRTVIRGVKKQSKYDFLKNYKHNKIKISEILDKKPKSKKEIEQEKKANLIIKEDLENYILFYKNNKNKKNKYNWSMMELLIIKIKLDIVDIINGYLNACDDIINSKKYIPLVIEYINNIIHHYKYNYLTNKNFNNIHKKIIQLLLSVKYIKIYDSTKFEIMGKLLHSFLKNKLFFLNDFYIFRQADEQTKTNLKRILIYCDYGNNLFSQIHL